MLNREKRLRIYMIVKKREFVFLKNRVFKFNRKILPIFKLKYLKFEQEPLNIKVLLAQSDTFCLAEGFRRVFINDVSYLEYASLNIILKLGLV